MEVAVKHVVEHADFASKFKHPVKFNGTDFVEERLNKEQQLAEAISNRSPNILRRSYDLYVNCNYL